MLASDPVSRPKESSAQALVSRGLPPTSNEIRVSTLLRERYPHLAASPRVEKALGRLLERLFLEQEVSEFMARYGHLEGIDFAEQVLEYFDFNYFVADRERDFIVPEGPVVVTANHPLGSLDAMALIMIVASVRPDVKVVANDVLMQVSPLRSILLPVDNMGGVSTRKQIEDIRAHLLRGSALIVFPAGEVSRLRPVGVRDLQWNAGFIRLASLAKAPIVPVHISGRNSMLFYGVSALFKPASTLLLVREMFKQRNKRAHFRVGQPIAYETYSDIQGGHKARANSIRKHLYRIGKGKPGLLPAQDPIAGPERAKALKHAMSGLERLGQTDEHIHIYLYKHSASCPIMREIGRLREVSFRAVGEGSGQRRDIDRFDPHYEHILLWNNENLEIVGAYRLAPTAQTIANRGIGGLYTSSLFDFDERFATELEHGIEMGRSFVQPKYWGRRSLHYLWIGIGAYLAKNPQYRYMFGPVSLSQQLPEAARDLLVEFYRRHFGDDRGGVAHHRPYATDPEHFQKLGVSFAGQDYKAEFRELRAQLTRLGVSVPTLYRQYSELCDPGGVRFLDFGIDPDFGNCIDGFVVVDIAKIAPEKRARYVDIHRVPSQDSAA